MVVYIFNFHSFLIQRLTIVLELITLYIIIEIGHNFSSFL